MTDRLLSRCLWFIIMILITGSALGSLVLLYSGLFRLISRQFDAGGMLASSGLLLAVGCWAMCKNCDDLIDRRF